MQIEDQSWPKKAKVETKSQTKTNNNAYIEPETYIKNSTHQNQQKRYMTSGNDKPFHIIYYL